MDTIGVDDVVVRYVLGAVAVIIAADVCSSCEGCCECLFNEANPKKMTKHKRPDILGRCIVDKMPKV